MKILIEESVLRQAVAALELMRRRPDICKELNAALDAAEKVEPVAWMDTKRVITYGQHNLSDMPLFTHPAPTVPEE